MVTNIFHNVLIDWGAGHLTVIVGTVGGAFGNKNCPLGRAFDHFFKCLGFAEEGGMLAAGIGPHITYLEGKPYKEQTMLQTTPFVRMFFPFFFNFYLIFQMFQKACEMCF